MKGSDFVFDYVHLLYYKFHKINPNCAGSYIDSLYWIKNKKAAVNAIKKKDHKSFQYAVKVALNHERITKHNCKEINFPSEKDDWKKFEKINVTITLNVLYVKKEKIYPAYVSKYNSNREKQVILLMILNEEGRHYLAVEKPLVLLRGITSKNNANFYCLNCLHSFRTKNKPESHKQVSENKDFCNVVMPSEETKIIEFHQYKKSL